MMKRCYKLYETTHPTYINNYVSIEFQDFQKFGEWYENNYINGFVLDKDILIKGNKIYSSDTCCFVPNEINNLFTKTNSKRGKFPIGVSQQRINSKYIAMLKINGKNKYLGSFININEAFNAYKIAKKQNMISIADKWKNEISDKVYQAMLNYQVEITD